MGESYERRRLQVPEPRVPGRGGRALFTAVVAVLEVLHSLLSRMRVTGGPLPAGGVMVVLNHRSTADGTLAAAVGRRLGRQLRLMGTAGIFTVPVLGRVLLAVGIVPVKRRSEQARGLLDGAVGMLAAGEAVGVFPEGAIRHRADGLPAELKTGAARLALTAGVPVVALGLWGADRPGQEQRHPDRAIPARQAPSHVQLPREHARDAHGHRLRTRFAEPCSSGPSLVCPGGQPARGRFATGGAGDGNRTRVLNLGS